VTAALISLQAQAQTQAQRRAAPAVKAAPQVRWKNAVGRSDLQGTVEPAADAARTPPRARRQAGVHRGRSRAYEKRLVDAGNVGQPESCTVQDVNLA